MLSVIYKGKIYCVPYLLDGLKLLIECEGAKK